MIDACAMGWDGLICGDVHVSCIGAPMERFLSAINSIARCSIMLDMLAGY